MFPILKGEKVNLDQLAKLQTESQTIVFVLDISGSMSASMAISEQKLNEEGNKNLRKLAEDDQNAWVREIQKHMPQGEQIMEIPRLKEVTRMQGVKAALISQIAQLHDDHRVGLIVFNDAITIYHDCTIDPIKIEGWGLSCETMDEYLEDLPPLQTLGLSKQKLVDRIKGLHEERETALGPSLYLGVQIAEKSKLNNKAKVILCTDGLANVGLGALDKVPLDQKEFEFYKDLYFDCKTSNVSVSISSFADCETGMNTVLGSVPGETGGMIISSSKTDPDLTEQMKKVVDTPIIATGADVRFIVNKNMFVGDEKAEENLKNELIGNVHREMTKLFSYGIKTSTQTDADTTITDADTTSVLTTDQTGEHTDLKQTTEPAVSD